MRITDIALSTPVTGARPAPSRKTGEGSSAPTVVAGEVSRGTSADEVAEVALQKAAGFAAATRVVAAQNELARASAASERLHEASVP